MNKRELSILQQAAAILDKEEAKYLDINPKTRANSPTPKKLLVWLTRDADQALTSLIHYTDKHPFLIEDFWCGDLANHIHAGGYPAEIEYGWRVDKQKDGTWDLCIFDKSLKDIEGSPVYEGYLTDQEAFEDVAEMHKRGFKIAKYS